MKNAFRFQSGRTEVGFEGNSVQRLKSGLVHENEENSAIKYHKVSIIIYIQKFLHSDWQRASQLIPNSAKT